MDFRQITMMQKIKSGMDRFRANHPKFPLFLRAVSQDALVEGSIIEINVTCLLYTSPSPRDGLLSRMPSSA